MQLSTATLKNIEEQNISKLRSEVISNLNKDRNDTPFITQAYADAVESKHNPLSLSLFNEDDKESKFKIDKTLWSFAMWKDMRGELQYDNFSELKLSRLIEMMEHLRDQNDSNFQITESIKPIKTSRENVSNEKVAVTNWVAPAIGGAIGVTAGILLRQFSISIVGGLIGAVVGVGYNAMKGDE